MAEAAAAAGISRIHMVCWRDLDHPEAGGAEEHTTQIGRHLVLAGLEVVHHTGELPSGPDEIVRDGVRVVRRGGRVGVFATSVTDELRGRMGPRDAMIDVFHGMPFFTPLWARGPRAAMIHHVHLGTWHHLLPAPADRVGHFIENRIVPFLYRNEIILTIADSTKHEIIEGLRLPEKNVRVVVNGIDPRFRPGGARNARPLVVAVARMMPQKGLTDLIPILAAVRERVPDLEAVIIGDGPQRPELEALRRAHGATEWLDLPGRLPDDELVAWYQRAWLAVSSSRREGFGLTLTEAAACGTPVVASRISGHVDAVVEGRTGHLVDGPVEFADVVVDLLDDEARRAALSASARDVAASFTWDATAAAVLDALCEDAARRRTSSGRRRR
jgi:glycosyltransferase involved in cell wall biosynthesis